MAESTRPCGKCGSEKVIPRVHVRDRGEGYRDDGLTAVVDENPGARLFKDPYETALRAHICGECGFVELYADNPGGLWRAHERAKLKR